MNGCGNGWWRGAAGACGKFNDWLLSFGTMPQAWIEKYGLD